MSRVQIGWLLAILGAILIIISINYSQNYWWLFFVGLIPYAAFVRGFFDKCPTCNRWWASIQEGSESLKRWPKTKEIKREDVTRDSSGNIISKTQRTEQVTIYCEKKRVYFRCKYCNARWSKIIVTQDSQE